MNAEFGAWAIQAYNLDPGNVLTERRRALRPDDEYSAEFGADSAEATAGVVAWLASEPGAVGWLGRWVRAPALWAELAPDRPPAPGT